MSKATFVSGTGARRPFRRGPATPFFEWTGPTRRGVDVGIGQIDLPIRYFRSDCFIGIFPADLDATRAALPSSRLHPVRLPGGQAAVGVVAYNYLETTVGPYGEIGVAALCTLDRDAPPLLPALLEGRWPGFGAFVLHLPVTTRIARQAGREIWGYPKFVADMAFDLRPEHQRVELREGGHDILSLTIRRGGLVVRDRRPLVTYTVHDGQLVRTSVAVRAVAEVSRGAKSGRLVLGEGHPVADQLHALGIVAEPAFTKSYLTHAAVLPDGEPIGPADRPYEGFAGSGALAAGHTLRYDRDVEVVVSVPAGADAVATA